MAVSLFRRWRSQKFQDLVGQESVVSTLQNVLIGGSPARAYLFCGPRGTGKTSSARIFAMAINCENGPAAEPCNQCHQCRSIADGSNMDVFEIDAASHTQVDKIRDFIVEKVHFTPVAARQKVYIIDEVHKLSTSSFNALLKTLEEPPSHVVFILATTHPHELPATILSRCQRYDFKPLTASVTEKHLLMIAEAEKLEVDADAARQLARAADGSLRDALVLFEQAVVFADGRVTRDKVLDLLGAVGYEVLEEMFLDLTRGQTAEALRRLDDWVGRGRDLKRLAESFQDHLRMMLLLKVRSEDQSIRHLASEERTSLERLCESMTVGAITSWLRQIMELIVAIRHGHGARLEWEMLLVGLAQPEIDPSLANLERRLERLEGDQEGAPRPTTTTTTAAAAALPAPVDDQLLSRLEALEKGAGPSNDPMLWERLTRLEAGMDAWKDRWQAQQDAVQAEVRVAPDVQVAASDSREAPEESSAVVAAVEEATTVAAEPDVEPSAPTITTTSFTATLLRDEVDDWLEMPPPLIKPSDFRRELSLFSTPPESTKKRAEPAKSSPPPRPETPAKLPQAAVGRVEDLPAPAPVKQLSVDEPLVEKPSVALIPEPVSVPVPDPVPTPAQAEASPGAEALNPQELSDFWRRLMQGVKETDIRMHAVMADARLIRVDQSHFEIVLPAGYDWHFSKLQEGRKLLEEVAGRLAGGRNLSLECALGGEKASPPKDSEHDDLVQRAAGVFGGASIVE